MGGAQHLLVLGPLAVFLIAATLALDLPGRVKAWRRPAHTGGIRRY